MNPLHWVPPSVQGIVGNYQFVSHCNEVLRNWTGGGIGSVLLFGPPGTGKSVGQIAFFRQLLNDPTLGYSGDEAADLVSFCFRADRQYAFMRIDGDSVTRPRLETLVSAAKNSAADHVFMLIDEIGVLYEHGLHEDVRTLLTHPEVSVWANAQDLGRKGEQTTDLARRQREAFLRRFLTEYDTELPTLADLVGHLHSRAQELGIAIDRAETYARLAAGVKRNPAAAVRCFGRVLARPKPRVLTAEIVAEYLSGRQFD